MVDPEDWEHPIGMSQMLGNSMATNVLLRVMVPLLRTARPDVSIQDPWYTGRIQRLLRRTARDPYDCTSVPPQLSRAAAIRIEKNARLPHAETSLH